MVMKSQHLEKVKNSGSVPDAFYHPLPDNARCSVNKGGGDLGIDDKKWWHNQDLCNSDQ